MHFSQKRLILAATVAATLALVLAITLPRPGRVLAPVLLPTPSPTPAVAVFIEPSLEVYRAQVEAFLKEKGFVVTAAKSQQDAVLALTPEKIDPADIAFNQQSVGTPVATLSGVELVSATQKPAGSIHLTNAKISAEELAMALTQPAPETWTLKALGDIIPGRTVYKIANQLHDQTAPYKETAAFTKDADLTLANLELALSDSIDHPTLGMAFSAPTTATDGLTYAGIDAAPARPGPVRWLPPAGEDRGHMMLLVRTLPCSGGGKNSADTHTARIVTVKGVKIALLGYSSIIGGHTSTAEGSGMNTLSMAPWGDFEEAPIAQMEVDIKAAKVQADVVFVYYHWGTEYTHLANNDQRTVAHRAVDAGADLILGTHPHWVQGVEWYNGKLITYSLGNFVFDQEWSTETKQGTILSATFSGKNLVAASLKPYQIEGYYQPRFTTAATEQKILGDVYGSSWWK